MKIFLLRHAESVANENNTISSKLPGAPLSQRGKEQANDICNEIASLNDIQIIYCSPFLRARETIKNVPFQTERIFFDSRIRELDYGDFDGLHVDSVKTEIIETLFKIFKQNDFEARFGITGENQCELLTRIYEFLIDVLYDDKPTLIVTHETIISILFRLNSKLRNCEVNPPKGNAKLCFLDFSNEDIKSIRAELEILNKK